MITQGFTYLAFLIFFSSLVILIEKKTKAKIFNYLPTIVIIYFSAMIMSTVGVWQNNESVTLVYKTVKDSLLPAMIFLMLLRCDMREIFKLGPKMIIGFLAASLSIALGFIITYGLLKGFYEPDTWKSFASLCGTWMGGTSNMVAIQGALDISDSQLGYALLIDSIDYSIWIMFLLWLVPFAPKFNKWTKASTHVLDELSERLNRNSSEMAGKKVDFTSLIFLLGLSLIVSAISTNLGKVLPQTPFLQATTWTVVIATALGIIFAMTPISKIAGSSELSNIMMYVIVALIASRANFAELTQAPIYIISGFMILGIHFIVLICIAKLFKLDLFTCGVASLANIGGTASAPILAGAYSEALIPIGVLMALMGSIVGTGGGLMVGKILSLM